MNAEHYKKLLLAKRRELQSSLRTLEQEGADPEQSEAGDYADTATNDQDTSDSLDRATILSRTLEEVQDALRRLEDGSFGKCTVCGRPINPERLEAVPWTPYCLEDQQRADGPIAQRVTL